MFFSFVFFSLVHFVIEFLFHMIFQIRKMDLEARNLPPNVKAVLLAKLREYKSDLNNLKSEVKRHVSGSLNASARDQLLESGMADTLTVRYLVQYKTEADCIIHTLSHSFSGFATYFMIHT